VLGFVGQHPDPIVFIPVTPVVPDGSDSELADGRSGSTQCGQERCDLRRIRGGARRVEPLPGIDVIIILIGMLGRDSSGEGAAEKSGKAEGQRAERPNHGDLLKLSRVTGAARMEIGWFGRP
jgi:hypothetical protein